MCFCLYTLFREARDKIQDIQSMFPLSGIFNRWNLEHSKLSQIGQLLYITLKCLETRFLWLRNEIMIASGVSLIGCGGRETGVTSSRPSSCLLFGNLRTTALVMIHNYKSMEKSYLLFKQHKQWNLKCVCLFKVNYFWQPWQSAL